MNYAHHMEKLKQAFQEHSSTADGLGFFQKEEAQLWVNSVENNSLNQQGSRGRRGRTQERRAEEQGERRAEEQGVRSKDN